MPGSVLTAIKRQPVFRLLLAGAILVALVPVGMLGVHLYTSAWESSWREIREKHQLLAENLAAPISIYINDHRRLLVLLADALSVLPSRSDIGELQILDASLRHLQGFRSLALVDLGGDLSGFVGTDTLPGDSSRLFASESCFLTTRDNGVPALSGIKASPITGKPSLFMSQPVFDADGILRSVLIAEMRIDLLESLRRGIRFGERGHSAIVDSKGRVIAHPNPRWMAQMKDLSNWPVVQEMMAGGTGVTQFHSPFVGEDMVAGYAAVPGIGWGVMVPQPRSEVAAQVRRLLLSNLGWGLAGLALAVVLAFLLARWITRPIDRLATASRNLIDRDLQGEIAADTMEGPLEVRQLGEVLRSLVSRLQSSRKEVQALNASLQGRIDDATRRLKEANARLEEAVRMDHLTSLANRRHFEQLVTDMLSRRKGDVDSVCIMLVDIDHFKRVNDRFGHAAGDAVLMHVASILRNTLRPGDLIARYGGDEFVARLRCAERVAQERAEQVCEEIQRSALAWNGEAIRVTVSVGISCRATGPGLTAEALVQEADAAMYAAKGRGRNTVVEHKDDRGPDSG